VAALFASLEVNATLHSLVLTDNQLSGEAFKCIGKALNTNAVTLRTLALSEGGIMQTGTQGDQLAALIGSSLSKNTSLTSLNLPNNMISDAGCGDIAASLMYNHFLVHLNLLGNKISSFGASKLGEVAPPPRRPAAPPPRRPAPQPKPEPATNPADPARPSGRETSQPPPRSFGRRFWW